MQATNSALAKTFIKTKPSMTMQNTGMLTLSEFKGMKDRILIGTMSEEQERKHQEKLELKEKSDVRVQNWPNTIQAMRKKKDDARFERFQKQEEERRRIDLEEAQYQAGVKHQILAKANIQIYESNDRVKAFQSALLLSDAMNEREAQIEINKRKKEIEKIVNDQYIEFEKENMREFDEREEEKKRLAEAKKREAEKILKEQHHAFKMKYITKLQEEKIEGEIIKIKTKEALEKEKQEEERRKQKILDAQEETRKANQLLEDMRRQERLRDLEKDKEIEAFAKKKEEIMEMRRMREDLKFKEKQQARQKIIDSQIEKLKAIKDKEDDIINKNIKEAEIKAEENERIKKEKRERLVQEIDKQIALTLEKKKNEKDRQQTDDKNFQEYWRQKNRELEEKELEDHNTFKDRCKVLQEYHRKQAGQKQKKLEDEINKEFEDALKMKAAIENEEQVFNSYASKCLNEWETNGKNIKPLLLELQKYKKKAL